MGFVPAVPPADTTLHPSGFSSRRLPLVAKVFLLRLYWKVPTTRGEFVATEALELRSAAEEVGSASLVSPVISLIHIFAKRRGGVRRYKAIRRSTWAGVEGKQQIVDST